MKKPKKSFEAIKLSKAPIDPKIMNLDQIEGLLRICHFFGPEPHIQTQTKMCSLSQLEIEISLLQANTGDEESRDQTHQRILAILCDDNMQDQLSWGYRKQLQILPILKPIGTKIEACNLVWKAIRSDSLQWSCSDIIAMGECLPFFLSVATSVVKSYESLTPKLRTSLVLSSFGTNGQKNLFLRVQSLVRSICFQTEPVGGLTALTLPNQPFALPCDHKHVAQNQQQSPRPTKKRKLDVVLNDQPPTEPIGSGTKTLRECLLACAVESGFWSDFSLSQHLSASSISDLIEANLQMEAYTPALVLYQLSPSYQQKAFQLIAEKAPQLQESYFQFIWEIPFLEMLIFTFSKSHPDVKKLELLKFLIGKPEFNQFNALTCRRTLVDSLTRNFLCKLSDEILLKEQ